MAFAPGVGRSAAVFAVLLSLVCTPLTSHAAGGGYLNTLWCQVTSFFGHPCAPVISIGPVTVTTTLPPPPVERANYTTATSTSGQPVYTTVVKNTYVTNPTTYIRESSAGGGSSGGNESFVSLDLFHKQVDSIVDKIGERVGDLRDNVAASFASIANAFTTALLTVTGNANIGGNLDVIGTLTAGSLAVSSVSSGGAVQAPYFTATSSTASTFPYASTTGISAAYASSTAGFFGSLSVGSLSGFLKATAGVVATSLIDLASDVGSSILAVANGGTGWANLQANSILLGNGSGRVATTTAGTNGQVLALLSGVPSWVATTTAGTDLSYDGLSFNVDALPNLTGTLDVDSGGTGAATFTNNRLLTGNGTSAIVDEANLTFDGSLLAVAGNASTTQLTTTGSAYLATTGGNVGIGTTTPYAKLSVQGAGTGTGVNFQTTDSSQTPLFTVLDNGNVGIGSTSPASLLSVAGNGYFTGNVGIGVSAPGTEFEVNSGVGSKFNINVSSNQLAELTTVVQSQSGTFKTDTSATYAGATSGGSKTYLGFIGTSGGGGTYLNFSTNGAQTGLHVTHNNGSDLMTVLSSGNVGIGTTTPSKKFEIYSTTNPTMRLDAGVGSVADLEIFFDSDGENRAKILADRDSGGGQTGFLTFSTHGAGGAGTAATERLRIDSSGNVGIGTTSPWRKLSVTGTVGFDGLTGAVGAGSLCLSANKEVVYNSGSDNCLSSTRATKHDIESLSVDALSIVNSLQPVSFVYNGTDRTRYGFIAEDTASIDAILATYNENGDLTGIDDRSILSVLVKAVQELAETVAGFAQSLTTAVLNATDVNAKRLCLDDVCITKDELRGLLDNDQQTPPPPPDNSAVDGSNATSTEEDDSGASDNELAAPVEDAVEEPGAPAPEPEESVGETASPLDPVPSPEAELEPAP